MVKRISFILSLLLIFCTFNSCAGINKEELLDELPSLIEKGRELLDIVYGEGLETDESGSASYRAGYAAVSESAPYTSIDELKNALSEVFSEAYTAVLCNTALNGVSYDGGSISPRYIESEDGALYADGNFEMHIEKREPKYDSIKITKSNRYMAEIEITMVYADGREEIDTVLVVNEDGKWKLDSAVL